MRILTVRQPWAWAIIYGGKTVENRVRNLAGDYRGPVAIHVAQREDINAFSDLNSTTLPALDAAADAWLNELTPKQAARAHSTPWHTGHGHIIGVVDLIDVHTPGATWEDDETGRCSDWAESDVFHLVLANPRALDQPIPWKGALGLRKSDLFVSGDWLGEYVDPGHSACTPYGCPPSCMSDLVARLVPAGPVREQVRS